MRHRQNSWSRSNYSSRGSLGVTLERADDQVIGAVGRMHWTFYDGQNSQTLADFDYTGFDGLGWYKDGSLRQAEETIGSATVQREFDYNPDGSLAYEERDAVPAAYQYQHGFLTQKGSDEYAWNGNKLTAIDGPDKQWRFLYTANGERSAWYEFAGASGDVNGDGCVDDTDLNLVLEMYGLPCTGCPEDLNDDSVVDDLDLAIVLETYGLNAWQWQYDALGRVIAAQSCNGAYQCEYDALGRRIWQSYTTSSGTETTYFLYGPGFEIELDDEGNVKAETAFGLLGPVARWTGSEPPLWYVSDGSGSVRVLLSAGTTNVSIAARYHYEALGGLRGDSEPDGFHQPYRLAAAIGARWEPGLGGASHPQGGVYVAELAEPQKARLFTPEGGLGIPQFSWEVLFDSAGWFLTGYGDNLTLGTFALARGPTGLGDVVPYHHPAYIAGSLTATAVYLPSAVVGTVQLAKMGYKVGASVWASAQAWRAGRTAQLAAQSLPQAAKLADDCGEVAYHYTTRESADSISKNGFQSGSQTMWVTPDGTLSAYQALLDLALKPNLPYGAILQVDLASLRRAGYIVSSPQQVARSSNLPGGGIEITVSGWDKMIPPQYFKWIR